MKTALLCPISLITFSACDKTKAHSHNFTVTNPTHYQIEQITFLVGNSKKVFAIASFSTSSTFNLTFDEE